MRRLVFLLCFAAAPACALEVEGGYSHENLDKGYADWKNLYLEATHDFAPRQTLYGALREVDRFDLKDTEVAAGYYHPLGASWTGQVEASTSSQHHFLAESSLFGGLAWAAGQGWVLSAGARFSEYTDTRTRLLTGGLERYFGSWRAGYTAYNGKPEDTGSASSHRLSLDYYYGQRSRVGAGVTWGREVENVGPPTGIITSDVRAIGLYGRHWITPDWAFTWDAGTHEQGDLYRRTGARLGLRYRF